jgi:hypothetical protein
MIFKNHVAREEYASFTFQMIPSQQEETSYF